MQLLNKRNLAYAGIFVAVLLVIVLGTISGKKSTSKRVNLPDLNSGQHYDASSGETISDPKGKGPDIYGVDKNAPTLLGFSKISDFGLTSDQSDAVKRTVIKYAKQNNINEVSLNVNSFKSLAPDQNTDPTTYTLTFDAKFNRQINRSIKVTYYGVAIINLYVYDSSNGALLFSSGEVGSADDTSN